MRPVFKTRKPSAGEGGKTAHAQKPSMLEGAESDKAETGLVGGRLVMGSWGDQSGLKAVLEGPVQN